MSREFPRSIPASAPLVLACAILPLTLAGIQAVLGRAPRLWAVEPAAWFALAWLGALPVLRGARRSAARTIGAALVLGLGAVALFLYAGPALRALSPSPAWLPELAPPAFLLLAWLWASTFGPPSRRAFLAWGGVLGLLRCLELGLNLAVLDRPPLASVLGCPDSLACVLVFCLCAALSARGEDRPGRAGLWLFAILPGLAACFSALALFTAGWCLLFFGPGRPRLRIPLFVLCLILTAGALILPLDQHTVLTRLEQSRQWLAVFQALGESPGAWLAGLPLDRALPQDASPDLLSLLQAIGRAPAMRLSELHAFWPRVIASWGLPGPLLLLVLLAVPVLRRPTAFGAGAYAACLSLGLTTPLFHSGNAAVVLVLALASASRVDSRDAADYDSNAPLVALDGRNAPE
ncbi:hypothetical protein M7784_09925 [Desulfovibrio aminophilus]|nr:hypothetical protein [Desulfovibrio aminophilus]MCM0755561.1 hypothetical protein [Desulfovibrio aminophilus]